MTGCRGGRRGRGFRPRYREGNRSDEPITTPRAVARAACADRPLERSAPLRAPAQPASPGGRRGGEGGGCASGAARGAEPPPHSAPFRGHARLPRTCSLRPQRARTLRSAAAPRCTSGEYGRGNGRGAPSPRAPLPAAAARSRTGLCVPAGGSKCEAASARCAPGGARSGAERGARRRALPRSEALVPNPVGGAR